MRHRPYTGRENSLPRGEGGPRSGSGEECGRKAESLYNITDLRQRCHTVGALVEVFAFPKSLHYRPHSSSVMEIAFGDFHDCFSPGEAILRCAPERRGRRSLRLGLRIYAKYSSAKCAALAPSAAAVMIWRRALVRTSPTAKTPGMLVRADSSATI